MVRRSYICSGGEYSGNVMSGIVVVAAEIYWSLCIVPAGLTPREVSSLSPGKAGGRSSNILAVVYCPNRTYLTASRFPFPGKNHRVVLLNRK